MDATQPLRSSQSLTPAILLAALKRRRGVAVFTYQVHQHLVDRITIGGRFAGHRVDGEFVPAEGFTVDELDRAMRSHDGR